MFLLHTWLQNQTKMDIYWIKMQCTSLPAHMLLRQILMPSFPSLLPLSPFDHNLLRIALSKIWNCSSAALIATSVIKTVIHNSLIQSNQTAARQRNLLLPMKKKKKKAANSTKNSYKNPINTNNSNEYLHNLFLFGFEKFKLRKSVLRKNTGF